MRVRRGGQPALRYDDGREVRSNTQTKESRDEHNDEIAGSGSRADPAARRRDNEALTNALSAAPEGSGVWNAGKWTNPRVEELTRAIASEMDQEKRTEMIHEALRIHKEDFGALPLHQQALAWGVSDNVAIKQAPNDFLLLEEIRMQ